MQRRSLTTDRDVVLPVCDKESLTEGVSVSAKAVSPQKIRVSPQTSRVSSQMSRVSPQMSWIASMKNAIRSARELRQILNLPPETNAADADYDFPVFVSREFLSRMTPGDPDDPLLRQVLPIADEGRHVAGFSDDPVGDLGANVAPGVLHKYHGRALMITTGACGIHCRYCFRREFPYSALGARAEAYEPSLEYLRQRPEIEEVILSGGDPLTSTDESLDSLISQIEAIDHVSRLRFHSRMPIVIPSRVTRFLCDRLKQSRLAAWMVVHANHAAEIDQETRDALERLVDAGIPTLNQSVLLRGVNDSSAALESLSRRLVECRVIPYYLHQLDRVKGAAHFEVGNDRGRELIEELESRLPGFAVPRYVSEIAGRQSKTRL